MFRRLAESDCACARGWGLGTLAPPTADLRPLFGKAFGHPEVLAPNFDKFLEDGLVFRNSYVQVAVCGPSRTSVLTGRRPDSTHINAQPPNSWCWAQRGYFMVPAFV
eukprot:SAG22_NODE_133_length_18379_cov_34.571937_8_plen_107_part_00